MSQTQNRFIDAATQLFAVRGFYGVSLTNIADELGLTKQALIHHFGNKEKLYDVVLQRISSRFTDALVQAEAEAFSPEDRLVRFFSKMSEEALRDASGLRLVLSELMDSRKRDERAGSWYLQPFLQDLVSAVQETRRWRNTANARALTVAYQVLGSLSYYAVSRPTLCDMYGSDYLAAMDKEFVEEFERTLQATFDGP